MALGSNLSSRYTKHVYNMNRQEVERGLFEVSLDDVASKKAKQWPGEEVHTLTPALERQRQRDLWEFKLLKSVLRPCLKNLHSKSKGT